MARGAGAKFHVYRAEMWEFKLAPKTVKIWNFQNKFAPQGRLLCTKAQFLSAY